VRIILIDFYIGQTLDIGSDILWSSLTKLRDETLASARTRLPPSRDSTREQMVKRQKGSRADAIFNFRPLYHTQPPVAIWSPVFAKFQRLMSAPETRQMTSRDRDKAFSFMKCALQIYDNNVARQAALQPSFGDGSRLMETKIFRVQGRFISGVDKVMVPQPGGGNIPAYTCEVDLKNEFGEGGSDPASQVESSYLTVCSSDEV
jgi:hypothetical protein